MCECSDFLEVRVLLERVCTQMDNVCSDIVEIKAKLPENAEKRLAKLEVRDSEHTEWRQRATGAGALIAAFLTFKETIFSFFHGH